MRNLALTAGLALLLWCTGCGRDAGAVSANTLSSPTGFDVISIDVASPHPLNAPIDITFSQDVDFATVSPNTVRIRPVGEAPAALSGGSASGPGAAPALGSYELLAPHVIRFRPACPAANEDGALRGAGLLPGQRYTVVLPGSAAGLQLLSSQGRALPGPRTASFATPYAGNLYADGAGGPPRIVVRNAGSSEPNASYLELGLEPDARAYFQRDLITNQVETPAGFLAPLNHRSRTDTRVAWMVEFDQPVDPTPENLTRVGLEYQTGPNSWAPFPAVASLDANCSGAGALVRVTPQGILPQDRTTRVRLASGFRDLVGEATAIDLATLPTQVATAFNPGTTTPGDDGDAFLERFVDDALEDPEPFELPRAAWGDGGLQARGDGFTGGPGGDFDWHVPAWTTIFLDTTSDTIIGGPNGAPTTIQTVTNGVVEVRNLVLPASSRIVALGPNPLRILATGSVDVQGQISVDGADSVGVQTLNATNIPVPGAAGRAGGGNGGTGSYLTTESTPRGGPGFGAFNAPELGGRGGEASFASTGKNNRRAAGGGGGRLGRDVEYTYLGTVARCQSLIGLDAEAGFGGGPGGLGAVSQTERAQGGAVGPVPFVDADDTNDFYGTAATADGALTGELAGPAPGAGGGAGGDAVNSATFPLVPFSNTGDERGAGGGAGGGVLHILARGDIVIGTQGRLTAHGGDGNGGENTSFFDRVGGGSGGGSGGSIVLETSGQLIVDAVAVSVFEYEDDPLLPLHQHRAISAVGGQGGAGNGNNGGANGTGNTTWRCDAIRVSLLDLNGNGCDSSDLPPLGPSCAGCFVNPVDFNDPLGPVLAAGGDGGPGLLQFHVRDSATDLVFQTVTNGDVTQVCAPRPIGWDAGWSLRLCPVVGTRSMNQTVWIALGQPRVNPVGASTPVAFFVDDLDALGQVRQSGQDTVDLGPALLGPNILVPAPGYPHITADPFTLAFDAAGISGFQDVFERNPALLTGARVRLEAIGSSQTFANHEIASALYDPALDVLAVTVDGAAGDLASFTHPNGVRVSLFPSSFALESGGVLDALSAFHAVEVSYDAAPAAADGTPDVAASYSASNNGAWALDELLLNAGEWDFVRARVVFDVDVGNTGAGALSTPPRLRFLRLPFRF